jgi:hypothetical protein
MKAPTAAAGSMGAIDVEIARLQSALSALHLSLEEARATLRKPEVLDLWTPEIVGELGALSASLERRTERLARLPDCEEKLLREAECKEAYDKLDPRVLVLSYLLFGTGSAE